jgi:hypothetical protein
VADEQVNLGPELQQLAAGILGILEPLVRAAVVLSGQPDDEPGPCQQAWCPLCAAAAVMTGERHPMTAAAAEHAASLLALLRAALTPDVPTPGGPETDPPAAPTGGPGHYQPLDVIIRE